MEYDTVWGPYTNGPEALHCLARFVDVVSGPGVGIVWTVGSTVYPLRAPHRDNNGFGDLLVFEWNPPAPAARKPVGAWQRLEHFAETVLEAEAQVELQKAETEQQGIQTVLAVAGRIGRQHRDDGLGVALDIVGIALTLALVPTGLGLVAGIAFIGGVALLATDSYAYAQEISGDEAGAEETKRKTEYLRIAATVLTLPDALYGGYRAIRELAEARELLVVDHATAASRTARSERAADPVRAAALQKTADIARWHAELRTREIRASLAHEITPRGAGLGSMMLLLREEITDKDSALHELSHALRFHCMAAKA